MAVIVIMNFWVSFSSTRPELEAMMSQEFFLVSWEVVVLLQHLVAHIQRNKRDTW